MGNCLLLTVPYGLADMEEDDREDAPHQRNIYLDWMSLIFRNRANTSPKRRKSAPDR